MTLKEIEKGITINSERIKKIKKLDSVVFDCDGVLIDVSNSYNQAIKKTVNFILKEMTQVNESILVTTEMIEGFKATGGFNDEVDVTYAIILAIVAATKRNEPYSKFIFKVINNADQTGIKSIEKYLDAINVDVIDIKKKLNYPSTKFQNPLSSIFDEIFYGSKLYTQLYKRKPQFFDGLGLIESDKPIREMSKNLIA